MLTGVVNTTLARRGTDAVRLVRALEECVGCSPGDAVYLSGSLVEGMANSRSDIDVFVVSDREASTGKSWGAHVVNVDGVAVDVEVWPRRRVAELIDRVYALPGGAGRDPRNALVLGTDELAFLHRLSIGLALVGFEEVRQLQARVDRRILSRVLFDRSAAIIPGQAADIAGLLAARDVDSAVVSAQRLLGSALDAMLAVDGNTNPSEKWRLRRLRDHLDRGLAATLPRVLRTFGSYDATRDLYLMRAWPGDDQRDQYREYAHACAHLGRYVIPWGQREVLREPHPKSSEELENGDDIALVDGRGHLLPRLAPEVMLTWKDDRLVLYTAGGTTEMEIGPVTAEALAYFDGRTPMQMATARLVSGRSIDGAAMGQALKDLSTVFAANGLVESPTEPDNPRWRHT